jgi:hypothetical protein
MAELIKLGIVGSYKLNGHAESSGGTISTDIHAVNKAFALNRSHQTEQDVIAPSVETEVEFQKDLSILGGEIQSFSVEEDRHQ